MRARGRVRLGRFQSRGCAFALKSAHCSCRRLRRAHRLVLQSGDLPDEMDRLQELHHLILNRIRTKLTLSSRRCVSSSYSVLDLS